MFKVNKNYAKSVQHNNVIYNESCESTMSKIGDGSVSIILTSPPYNTSGKNTKTQHSIDNHDGRYDIYIDNGSHEEYCNTSKNWFNEFDRILKKNGVVLYNINYGTDSTNSNVSANDLINTLHSIINGTNFMIADIIIWKKSSALPNNTSSNKCTRIWEFVFVLCRKSENKTFLSNKQVKSTSKSGQNFYENMFNIIEAPNNDGSNKLNKATFSSDLVIQLLNKYAGDTTGVVYDPFMGTGTTAVGVLKYNRVYGKNYSYLGSELSANQCDYAKYRISEVY